MKNYRIPMIPDPTRLNPVSFKALTSDFGASYQEEEFYEFYGAVGRKLARLMGTENEVILQPGEGMAVLWGAVKSTLKPGENAAGGQHGPVRRRVRRHGEGDRRARRNGRL